MGNVAQLFPYRDADNRLMFRGKIGVESKVSKFFPVRVDGRLMLRGKQANGKILWGYPYRDSEGRLMGRTIRSGFTTPCGCTACHIVVTLSGFPEGFGSGACSTTNFRGLNGTHTLTLDNTGCRYYKGTSDYDLSPYSGCTIAEAFPAAGTQFGPHISVSPSWSYPGSGYIRIWGKGNGVDATCEGRVDGGLPDCGHLANLIGHTWNVRFLNFTATMRLDAML